MRLRLASGEASFAPFKTRCDEQVSHSVAIILPTSALPLLCGSFQSISEVVEDNLRDGPARGDLEIRDQVARFDPGLGIDSELVFSAGEGPEIERPAINSLSAPAMRSRSYCTIAHDTATLMP